MAEYRTAERKCNCRFCNKTIERNTEKAIFHYSHYNRGMHIILCKDCISRLYWKVFNEELITTMYQWLYSTPTLCYTNLPA